MQTTQAGVLLVIHANRLKLMRVGVVIEYIPTLINRQGEMELFGSGADLSSFCSYALNLGIRLLH
jgi:hypothetical protein